MQSFLLYPQEIVLKVQAADELGAWAKMTTICKKALDITQYAESDQEEHAMLLSMPFTEKSGFGSAPNGSPELHIRIKVHMIEVSTCTSSLCRCYMHLLLDFLAARKGGKFVCKEENMLKDGNVKPHKSSLTGEHKGQSLARKSSIMSGLTDDADERPQMIPAVHSSRPQNHSLKVRGTPSSNIKGEYQSAMMQARNSPCGFAGGLGYT